MSSKQKVLQTIADGADKGAFKMKKMGVVSGRFPPLIFFVSFNLDAICVRDRRLLDCNARSIAVPDPRERLHWLREALRAELLPIESDRPNRPDRLQRPEAEPIGLVHKCALFFCLNDYSIVQATVECW